MVSEKSDLWATFWKAYTAKPLTQPTTQELEAANRFLNDLADRLPEALAEKVAKGEFTVKRSSYGGILGEDFERAAYPGSKFGRVVRFNDESLEKVSARDVVEMSGYKRLKDICKSPAVNKFLGEGFTKLAQIPFHDVVIYIDEPASGSAPQARASKAKKHEGRLQHTFR